MEQIVTTDLGGIHTFDCDEEPTTVGLRWQKWRRAIELFVVGKEKRKCGTEKDSFIITLWRCRVFISHFIFLAVLELDGDEMLYDIAMEQHDKYFRPRVNKPFERHGFRLMTQEPTESVDQIVTRLKAQHCNFDQADKHIRDQVIEKCKLSHLRRELLNEGVI